MRFSPKRGDEVSGRYETVKPPRFEVEQTAGGERIRVRIRRNVFALLFLPVWLVLWTIGGIAAMTELARGGEPFLAVWLCFWAVAELAVILSLAWLIWGAELIGVIGGDLEIGQRLFGLTRSRLYRGRDVRDLAAAEAPPFYAQTQFAIPFMMKPRWGAVKFNYGGRTIFIAQGLDEAEGRMIVERLRRRLPGAVA